MDNEELVNRLIDVEAKGISSTRFNNVPIFWDRAEGSLVFDFDGNQYLDCTSSYGVMGIGYSHKKLIRDIKAQLGRITHTMCEIYPHEMYLNTIEKIRQSVGRSEEQVLLTTSGSEAVEVALKLCYRYTKKEGIIAFQGAFHGQTLGALSVTSHNSFRNPFMPQISKNTIFTPFPNVYRNDLDSEETLLKCCIAQIENLLCSEQSGLPPIGAIIVEPMQNASGYIIPPKGFLREIKKICVKYNILMVVDEIFTGFGRCGKWLMVDYEDVKPDIICVGKVMTGGFPAAACIASKEIMKSLDYEGLVPLHGSTFTGNAVSCSAISSTIDILKNENLVSQSYDNGEYLRNCLRSVFQEFPYVGDIRGYGSATMLEFVYDRHSKERNAAEAKRFANYLLEKKIISLVSGLPYGNCVAFCTPFVMTKSQLSYIVEICERYVKKI